jgi:hypothetical protein
MSIRNWKVSKAEKEAKKHYTSQEMEIILAKHFNFRRNIIVPNISYGILDYEADLVILTPSGYATEIEIKVTASDLKKDLKKRHKHRNDLIHYFYFAIPHYLEKYIDDIPKNAGILKIKDYGGRSYVSTIRGCYLNKVPKWDDAKRKKITRLSTMRIWSLKEKLFKQRKSHANVDGKSKNSL